MSAPSINGRLRVVSNRLPVSVKHIGNGQYDFHPTSGGLVAGLLGLANSGPDFLWYGWPGVEVPCEHAPRVQKHLLGKHNAVPVLLDDCLATSYYDGFSNSTLWPLLHYQLEHTSFQQATFEAYLRANHIFAETLACDMEDGDLIWIHDYHLMLLPLLLRKIADQLGIKIRIGWFLHTPFPSEDFFTILPDSRQILEGILGADLIGFHTDKDRRHFLFSCSEIFDHWVIDSKVYFPDREVLVQTHPIGIEPSEFRSRLEQEDVQNGIETIKARFAGAKIVLGVDRLDHIKGLPHKLEAFDAFLERHPESVGKAFLMQVVVPSRANLEVNKQLLVNLHRTVSKINEKHGIIGSVPIHFYYRSVTPNELTALYASADVCFVSSIRDGMNLVCYEYIACHPEDTMLGQQYDIPPGILILSQFSGAASVLQGCLLVNPWDRERCANVLKQALSMGIDEAKRRMAQLGTIVDKQTSYKWGLTFVQGLQLKVEQSLDDGYPKSRRDSKFSA